jgi:hypothetical protein
VGEGESASGESDNPKDDENNPDYGGRLHGVVTFPSRCWDAIGDDLDVLIAVLPHQLACSPGAGVICFYTGKEDDPAYEN